jgi:hypothetical protein
VLSTQINVSKAYFVIFGQEEVDKSSLIIEVELHIFLKIKQCKKE